MTVEEATLVVGTYPGDEAAGRGEVGGGEGRKGKGRGEIGSVGGVGRIRGAYLRGGWETCEERDGVRGGGDKDGGAGGGRSQGEEGGGGGRRRRSGRGRGRGGAVFLNVVGEDEFVNIAV